MDGLRGRVGSGVRYRVELRAPKGVHVATEVGALTDVIQVKPCDEGDEQTVLEVRAAKDPRTAIAGLATQNGWEVRAMERHAPNLEEAFLHLIGGEA